MKKLLTMMIVVGTFYACGRTSQERSEIRSVTLTEPVLLKSSGIINYSGIIREAHTISLGFKTAGQIERIHVREGDYIHQGQLLAELDDADYRLGVEALQIQYDQLKNEVERTKQLFDQKSVSANDYEKAVAGLQQLGVQLQMNKNKLGYTKLYALTDGYVQAVNFSPAEMVDAGTALFTLLDVSHMEVITDIPVNTYRQKEHFIRYYCKAAGIEQELPMKLSGLTPKADGNQLYELRLVFAGQPDEQLTAGMNVEIGIVIEDTTSASGFVVPLCAVFQDKETEYVWIIEQDSTVTRRRVTLGNTDAEGRAVILEGLTGKEQIVRAGVNVLQEGQKIRVIEKPGKTNIGGLL